MWHLNIFGYLFSKLCGIRVYSDIRSVNYVASEYIRIFVRVLFMIFAHHCKVCMAPFNVGSTVCITFIHVRSKVCKFAPHMNGSNADFARHIEERHADFAPHMEWRHSCKDQIIAKTAIFANFQRELFKTTHILGDFMTYDVTTFMNSNILRESTF